MASERHTGHYSRHSNNVIGLGHQPEGGYSLAVPGTDVATQKPASLTIPCLPLHEALDEELQAHDADDLQEQLQDYF